MMKINWRTAMLHAKTICASLRQQHVLVRRLSRSSDRYGADEAK